MDHSSPGVTTPGKQGDLSASARPRDPWLAAEGDARAFERLYREQVARIHSLARRMIGPEEAGEVTQDVFVRAWEKLGTYRGEAAFGTWLYRVAINVILARRSAHATRRARHASGDEVLETVPDRRPPDHWSLDFETAIDQLPEGARQIFVLHDVEGYKHDEIAALLGVTSGTSKAQLHRARMMLRRSLRR